MDDPHFGRPFDMFYNSVLPTTHTFDRPFAEAALLVSMLPTNYDETSNAQSELLVKDLVNLCRTEQASRIVMGLPLHKNGTNLSTALPSECRSCYCRGKD